MNEQKEFFQAFARNRQLEKFKADYSSLLGHPCWWLVEKIERDPHLLLKKREPDCATGGCRTRPAACFRAVSTALNSAKRSKEIRHFVCPARHRGLIFPLVRGDRARGFVVLCHIKKDTAEKLVNLIVGFLGLIADGVGKELELSFLSESTRSRIVALSTIHTVHRLVSSTLDLKQLLPQIARLSLQTLRARKCSVRLLDKNRRFLLPRVTLDLSNRKVKEKKIKVGEGILGKVVVTGSPSFRARSLAVPLIDKEPIGVITVGEKADGKDFSRFEQEILLTLAEQAVVAIRNTELSAEQEKLTRGTIRSLSRILDEKRSVVVGETGAFVNIVQAVGRELRLSEEDLKNLRYAAEFHRVSYAVIPERILRKKAKLTEKEYRVVREHPSRSAELIAPLGISPVRILLYHHERYDGTGYPKGLRGQQIPIGSRILAVVEAFEAMISPRNYRRKARDVAGAMEEIERTGGAQFDPRVVRAFLKVMARRNIRSLLRKEGFL